MRFLKSSVLLPAICFVSLWAAAQNGQSAQAARQAQPAAKTPATGEANQPGSVQDQPSTTIVIVPRKSQQAPQNPDDRLQTREAFKVPPEALQKAVEEARERERFQAYRSLTGDSSRRADEPGGFDRGIYLSQIDGANVCGSIVSYHFSQGDNPVLKGVTTCTPWNAVVSKRANGPNRIQGPQLIRTVYHGEEKKRPD